MYTITEYQLQQLKNCKNIKDRKEVIDEIERQYINEDAKEEKEAECSHSNMHEVTEFRCMDCGWVSSSY